MCSGVGAGLSCLEERFYLVDYSVEILIPCGLLVAELAHVLCHCLELLVVGGNRFEQLSYGFNGVWVYGHAYVLFCCEVAKAGVVGIYSWYSEGERLMELVGYGVFYVEVFVWVGSPHDVGLLVELGDVVVGISPGESDVCSSFGMSL